MEQFYFRASVDPDALVDVADPPNQFYDIFSVFDVFVGNGRMDFRNIPGQAVAGDFFFLHSGSLLQPVTEVGAYRNRLPVSGMDFRRHNAPGKAVNPPGVADPVHNVMGCQVAAVEINDSGPLVPSGAVDVGGVYPGAVDVGGVYSGTLTGCVFFGLSVQLFIQLAFPAVVNVKGGSGAVGNFRV